MGCLAPSMLCVVDTISVLSNFGVISDVFYRL